MTQQNDLDLLADLVARARTAGADAADAILTESLSSGVSWRMGKPEDVERSESRDVGLRVFVGQRQALTSSSDTSPAALAELVERGIAMARAVPEDRWCGLADPELLGSAEEVARLDGCDQSAAEAAGG